nr:MAG: replication associated protein [Cressdnaviricota sp.]
MCACPFMSKVRNFIVVQNNYVDTSLLDNVDCRYICYSREVAPTTATPHLQGFLSLVNATTVSSIRKKLPGCHVETANGSIEENINYCSGMCEKKGNVLNPTFVERGDRPMSNTDKGRAEQLKWHRALELAKAGKVDEIDADIQFRYYSTCNAIALQYAPTPEPLADVCGEWWYGPPKCGKSAATFREYPGHLVKKCNKNFQNWHGQEVIVVQDVGHTEWKNMVSFLMEWTDMWPFQADIKYSGAFIRPKKVICTSNFSLEELCDKYGIMEPTREAFIRRFKVREFKRNKNFHI